MSVYLVRAGGCIKIGYASRPWDRLGQIQTHCPLACDLIAVIPGDLACEQALHVRFAEHRVRGEWFQDTGALAEFAAAQMRPAMCRGYAALADAKTYRGRLVAHLRQSGRNAQVILGDQIGKRQASISRYATGDRFPDAATARLIHDATGGAVPFSLWVAETMARMGIEAEAA